MATVTQRLTTVPIVNVMAQAAFKAARALIRDFNEVENLVVSDKGAGDFVSTADTRAETIIFKELQKSYPNYGFLIEEQGEVGNQNTYWVIDPLDGTYNFLHSIPHFCISIALIKNGQPHAGIIYDPIRDELFWTERGRGSFLNNRRLRVSLRKELRGSLVMATLHNVYTPSRPPHERACFDELFKQTRFRIFGSAALNLAYIAAARADIFVGFGLKAWDVAAGNLIIQEAGGSLSPFDPRQDIFSGETLIATNDQLIMPVERIFKSFCKKA